MFIAITYFFVLSYFFTCPGMYITLSLLDRVTSYRVRLLSTVVLIIFRSRCINVYTISTISTTSWLLIRCSRETKDSNIIQSQSDIVWQTSETGLLSP